MSNIKNNNILADTSYRQKEIREYFRDPTSPYIYINYATFLKNFPLSQMNFKDENLNIIDVHLRYRWWVREKMAPLKWLPIILMTPLIYPSYLLVLVVPWFTTKMFDHYFQKFFLWKYRDERVINVRGEFITKLSKQKNKIRRIAIFDKISNQLRPQKVENLEAPIKYIKFGEFTQYIFHAFVNGKEQSSFLQTTFFENFLKLKNIFWELTQPSNMWNSITQFKNDFVEFRGDPNRKQYHLNINSLVDRPGLKDVQIYTLQDNLDHNIRRWGELWNYTIRGSLEPNTFKLWQYTNFSNYKDIFEPLRYNCKDNWPDLLIYYSVLGVPKLLNVLFRRR